ncbi:beta-propeller domain-containing protein, partial [Candidatus Saccharibacteria bacterium]|nr:beta-propeller domain-containing protein [Candidatus Saccharibacteria bacterium]
LLRMLGMPFSLIGEMSSSHVHYSGSYDIKYNAKQAAPMDIAATSGESGNANEFSTTNIQVENVDEADIIKTDGDYMYSISDTDVIISDVRDTAAPSIAARIAAIDDSVPEDLILSGDTLTVIGMEYGGGYVYRGSDYYLRNAYKENHNTTVRVYDIADRKNPRLEKNFKLYEPYYTSRRIGDKLYVISSGLLREKTDGESVEHVYFEDSVEKEYPVKSIRYLNGVRTDHLTLISVLDLGKPDSDIMLEPFLMDISNAYISENAFYLLEEKYGKTNDEIVEATLKALFGFKGVIGLFDDAFDFDSDEYQTEIFKFDIDNSGDISYKAKAKTTGATINQYSLDENNGHLRVALHDNNGSYVVVFDEKMNELGKSGHLARNEKMYASRFLGDKAYLVTYRNTDPLFVIDLSNESSPKVLGELKIPGYSVYLHPYDETHLIGIGMDTQEETRKDASGRVISSWAYITGMKMALFDVSDFKNPKEISKIHIGNASTSSAILDNPKALLFSKEKHLLGIPVNHYESEFKIKLSGNEDNSQMTSRYKGYENYVSEGYIVYDIDTENGIKERGEVIHEKSELIRGAYINNDLLTVSDSILRVNNLEDLSLKAELGLKEEQ